MMSIDEAIKHAREVAEENYKQGFLCHANPNDEELDKCIECAREHEQLAEWLEELKRFKDLQEHGRLLELPCGNWMDIVFGEQEIFWGIDRSYVENPIREITVDNAERFTWYDGYKTVVLKGADENGFDWEFSPTEIGKTVFLTREEAEKALEEKSE